MSAAHALSAAPPATDHHSLLGGIDFTAFDEPAWPSSAPTTTDIDTGMGSHLRQPTAPCAIQPRTALELYYSPIEWPVLSSGLISLDTMLRGGFRPGITELVGEAGAAKSQFCFQLLLQVQLPTPPTDAVLGSYDSAAYGLNGCGLYIGTEGEIPINRIEQMQRGYYQRHPWTDQYHYMDGIFTHRVKSIDELKTMLGADSMTATITENNIKLIVIDSIAGLFRFNEYDTHPQSNSGGGAGKEVNDSNFSSARSNDLFSIAATLKRLSTLYRLIVIVANQVTDRIQSLTHESSHYNSYTVVSSGRQVMPALGLSWSSCVNTRIALTRSGGGRGVSLSQSALGGGAALARQATVIFAPHVPAGTSCAFNVDNDGLSDNGARE